VCLATLGPGATNLLTGVADAHLDHSPLVAITGQGSLDRLYKESHQVINVVRMFFPVTKWTDRITNPRNIPEMVRKAFKLAEMEKPGATHIEFSENIAAMLVEELPALKKITVRRSIPEPETIRRAAELIRQAKKPLILTGNGAIRTNSSHILRQWVAQTNIPVVSTFMGKGAVSDREPESLLSVGLGAHPGIVEVLKAADLVIAVGYDIAEYGPEKWNADKHLKIIHIDFAQAEVYEQYIPEVELVGDISDTLEQLSRQVTAPVDFPEARAYRKKIEARWEAQKEVKTLKPEMVLHTLREVMRDDDILISDVGSHKMWVGSKFQAYEPNTVLISNGFASMGFALPGAIGAKLACPDKRVVSLNGDGGFLMNVQELETATRLGLAFPVLIFNDSRFSLIEEKFRKDSAITDSLEFTNPDFEALAKAFGIHHIRIETREQLREGLKHALECSTVCLVDIHIDAEANRELFNQE
ncbi:MAG: hypothetical protein ACD_28C00167G0001, partial [uncultured bacterium]